MQIVRHSRKRLVLTPITLVCTYVLKIKDTKIMFSYLILTCPQDFFTKAELLQLNYTQSICLINFINKNVGNRINQDHNIISTFKTDII